MKAAAKFDVPNPYQPFYLRKKYRKMFARWPMVLADGIDCRWCRIWKYNNQFYGQQRICKECDRRYCGGQIKAYYFRTRANGWRARFMRDALGVSPTFQEWAALVRSFSTRCLRCKRKFPLEQLELDHVYPVSKGGTNTISNVQPLCTSCNVSKNDGCVDYRHGVPVSLFVRTIKAGGGKKRKPLESYPCTCGGCPEYPKTTCPRGLLIWRRNHPRQSAE